MADKARATSKPTAATRAPDANPLPAAAGSKSTSSEPADTGMAGKVWTAKKGAKYDLSTPCGEKHDWQQMSDYVKHCKKFKCMREGCGFFKKCWTACENIDCTGCHVPAHKRW